MATRAANTTARAAVPGATAQIRYDDLYARWERGNWVSTEVDFEQDRHDWNERMTSDQRSAALWIFSLFFHGEDAVAEQLAPFIGAAPAAEHRYFLATQQADEVRHSAFFKRFLHEVAGRGDGSVRGGLTATEEHLTWGHRQTFAKLEEVSAELGTDPSPARLAAALTLYHVLIEGTIAQPSQHVLDQALEDLDLLPGFRRGLEMVSKDEQRHIAFGVKLISDLLVEDPEAVEPAITDLLVEMLPYTAAFACPAEWDADYERAIAITAPLGFTLEDVYDISAASAEDRLRATGLRIDEIPRIPIAVDIPVRERGIVALKLVHAGFLGAGDRPAQPSDEALALFFDQMRRRADPTQVPPGTVIQWEFTDADPWYIELEGERARAAPGPAAKPDLRLRVSLQDWVDLAAGRGSAGRLLLSRRLRIRGRPRVLARFGQVFA